MKEWYWTGAANSRPPDHQSSMHPTELPCPVQNLEEMCYIILETTTSTITGKQIILQ